MVGVGFNWNYIDKILLVMIDNVNSPNPPLTDIVFFSRCL